MVSALIACNPITEPGDGGTGQDLAVQLPVDLAGRDLTVVPNLDALFYKDPPLMYCGLDGGNFNVPPPPTGTADCPSDKNREGCPCTPSGTQPSCWPGLRKNRNLGVCKDGKTTCVLDELGYHFGSCMGYQLPTGTTGAGACNCFSSGQWKLDNLEPCFYDNGGGPGSQGAVSTIYNSTSKMYECPTTFALPSLPYSPNTVSADCQGHFKLCYTFKAGSASNPLPTDCTFAQSCTEADLTQTGVAQKFPDLPPWITTTAQVACAKQAANGSYYGEMSVVGTSITCDAVQSVFNRVQYCPLSCTKNPNTPMCMMCMNGGSGMFP